MIKKHKTIFEDVDYIKSNSLFKDQFSLLTSMRITSILDVCLFIISYKAHINALFCVTIF